MWKLRKFSLTLFWQKFRESNIFTKENNKVWFDGIFFLVRVVLTKFIEVFATAHKLHHSWPEKLLQVMKDASKIPLTQGTWDPLGPFKTKIEKIQPGLLTYQFSKNKKSPIWSQKSRVAGMVHQHFTLLYLVLNEIRC